MSEKLVLISGQEYQQLSRLAAAGGRDPTCLSESRAAPVEAKIIPTVVSETVPSITGPSAVSKTVPSVETVTVPPVESKNVPLAKAGKSLSSIPIVKGSHLPLEKAKQGKIKRFSTGKRNKLNISPPSAPKNWISW